MSTVGAVATMVALAAMVRMERTAQGTVQLQQGEWVDVPAPLPGRVVSVDVGLGQQVTAGQGVARLETAAGQTVEVQAPRAATVGRVQVAKGAEVAAGQSVVALVDRNAPPSLTVRFPAEYRAELAPGMTLEYRLEGMASPAEAVIEKVEGPEDGAVLVRAHAPVRGEVKDGVKGQARVGLGTQRLLVAWLPGLRHVLP